MSKTTPGGLLQRVADSNAAFFIRKAVKELHPGDTVLNTNNNEF